MIPPVIASSTLSVSNWRTRRARPAPSAVRIAISFCRAADLANSKLATFAQAISRTNATAPSNTSSAGRVPATTSSYSENTFAPCPVLTGYCCSS